MFHFFSFQSIYHFDTIFKFQLSQTMIPFFKYSKTLSMYNFAQICLIYFDNISISYGLHFCRSHVFEKYTFFLFPYINAPFHLLMLPFSRKEWLVSVTIEQIETVIYISQITHERQHEKVLSTDIIKSDGVKWSGLFYVCPYNKKTMVRFM